MLIFYEFLDMLVFNIFYMIYDHVLNRLIWVPEQKKIDFSAPDTVTVSSAEALSDARCGASLILASAPATIYERCGAKILESSVRR